MCEKTDLAEKFETRIFSCTTLIEIFSMYQYQLLPRTLFLPVITATRGRTLCLAGAGKPMPTRTPQNCKKSPASYNNMLH